MTQQLRQMKVHERDKPLQQNTGTPLTTTAKALKTGNKVMSTIDKWHESELAMLLIHI